jgi:hypothetical protein
MNSPSIKQMRARMNSGHRKVLIASRDGKPLKAMRLGDAKGLATCRATLRAWGAIDAEHGDAITAIGRALLDDSGNQTLAEFREANPGLRRDARVGGAA